MKQRSNSESTSWNKLLDIFDLRFQARDLPRRPHLVKHVKRQYHDTELVFITVTKYSHIIPWIEDDGMWITDLGSIRLATFTSNMGIG